MIKQLRRSNALLEAFDKTVRDFERSDRNFTKLENLLVNTKLLGKINKTREQFDGVDITSIKDTAIRTLYLDAMFESLVIESAVKVTLGLRNSNIIDSYDLDHDLEAMSDSLVRVFDNMQWAEISQIKNRVQYVHLAFTILTMQLVLKDTSIEAYRDTVVNSNTLNTRTFDNKVSASESEYVTLIQDLTDLVCKNEEFAPHLLMFLLKTYNVLTDYDSHVKATKEFYLGSLGLNELELDTPLVPDYRARLVF